jgi:signal peptidase I
MIVVVFGCVWLIQNFVVNGYVIPSSSMEPTLQVNDKIFSEHLTYYQRAPQAGDIVTFHDPEVADRTLVKRCIATEGQTVDLIDGTLYIDGVSQDQSYTHGLPSYPLSTAPGVTVSYPYTVPKGEIWVMGDNRTNSADSRYLGAIPVSSVTGRVCCIYWPFDHFITF